MAARGSPRGLARALTRENEGVSVRARWPCFKNGADQTGQARLSMLARASVVLYAGDVGALLPATLAGVAACITLPPRLTVTSRAPAAARAAALQRLYLL